jgi:hypothetical protein
VALAPSALSILVLPEDTLNALRDTPLNPRTGKPLRPEEWVSLILQVVSENKGNATIRNLFASSEAVEGWLQSHQETVRGR